MKDEYICYEWLGKDISLLFENGFVCNFIYEDDKLESQEILPKEETKKLYLAMKEYYER